MGVSKKTRDRRGWGRNNHEEIRAKNFNSDKIHVSVKPKATTDSK